MTLRKIGVAVLLVLGLSLPTAATAGAASLTLSPGEYLIDTSTLTLSNTGGTIAIGVDEGGVAVFSFDSINIPAGAEVFAEGSRPLELRSAGTFTLGGLIEASGFDAENFTAGPNPGGPGGGAGGTGSPDAGQGPGGGGATSNIEGGGGGGGFGGNGAAGGGPGAGSGGSSYGDLEAVFQGGSGGSGGANGTTGGGGGAVKLTAASLSIPASGQLFAEGGNGAVGAGGASGGGSGGGILLHAGTIDVAGLLSAAGGAGGCCGDGGGGGGGRIAYQYGVLANAGMASVVGGESGVINNGAFLGHGSLSPQVTGAPGVVTQKAGPTPTTSSATAVGLTGATLNGTVNPHGHATTYQFQFGTSTAYGATIPIPAGNVGSDSSDHALSQVVTGLTPATTYHYRIVATGFGFTFPGADMTFTTAAKCAGVKISKGRVKVKNGKAPIKLSSAAACKGSLALFMKVPPKGKAKGHGKGKASASKKKGKGGKAIQVGSASFSLEAGQAKTIEVPLSAAALKRLSLGKALPATAKATATDGLGPKVTTQANVSLKLAKKGKGPKKHG